MPREDEAIRRCDQCGVENPPNARFCLACGVRLAIRCGACQTELPAAAKFCLSCGAPVGPRAPERFEAPQAYTPPHLVERILTSRGALEGERKHVTVLFADVVGFTALAERVDPEDAHGIMDRCFELLLAEVHAYEGTVNQFTGDGVMALFGAPVALEDAPRRAVLAALGIQRAVASLRAELLAQRGLDFRMRIGLHTGLVVVGKIGNDLRMDYTAVGDTVNLAARLQAAAAPGTVLISEATHRLITGFFETRDLGSLRVKGKREPVRAFEVVAERGVQGRIDALASSGLTPFVGRARELAALAECFASARTGRGQVVFLVGDAGLGKSRLLWEFRQQVAPEGALWLEGRCASYGQSTAFLPIVDALRRFFGVEERDDEAEAVAKLERGVAGIGAGLEWTLPLLRQLFALSPGDERVAALDAASRRAETFRALKALTLQAAQTRPLVLVIEDLHWIDAASEEYLAFLADVVAATRALLVCSHRPGYRHPFGDRSYHVRISLQPLTDGDTTAITGSILGATDVPASLRELIARKAEGNPFFVEEVTKSLLEQGALALENGRVVLARELGDVAVPDSIQDVLMARIDRLPDDPKRAIQIASVIGREFAVRLLQRISELGERVGSLVEELRTLELVYEKASHPELAYMFKHALTHDVAYASILVQRRKELHALIGRTIEDLYGDRLAEHYETLAHHFAAGEDWERALLYHERAAHKAFDAYANKAAIEHARRALAVADRIGLADERRRELEEILAGASFFVNDFRVSGDAYTRAARLTSDGEARALHLGRAAHSYVWGHAYDEATATYEEARREGEASGKGAGEALARLIDIFLRAIREGCVPRLEATLQPAVALADRSGNDEVRAVARFFIAELAEWRGDYRRTLAACAEAIEIARRQRLAHVVIWLQWFGAKAACCLGQYGRAMTDLRAGVDLCDRIGDRAWKTRLLNTLGWCFAEIGSHEHARAFNQEAAVLAAQIGDPEIMANAEINLAANHLALGDPGRAAASLVPLHDALGRPGDPWMRWRYGLHVLEGVGQVALAADDPGRALGLAEQELSQARSHGVQKVEARAQLLRGRALLMLDRRDEADAALAAAAATGARIGYQAASWRALAVRAEVARRRGAAADAEARAGEARSVVSGLAQALDDAELRRALHAELGRFETPPPGS